MALIWRDKMSVGNDVIDKDHRYMVCFLNTVTLALQKPEEREVLLSALTQLYNYAYEHFMREEIIQKKISYPELIRHRHEHKELLEELLKLKNKIEFDYSDSEINDKYEDLVLFLKHWLMDHVLKTDLKLKSYLAKFPNDFS